MSERFASCCVLSFERPDFLREGVESLLANADAPLELIVHDDGSRDRGVYDVLGLIRGRGATVITNAIGQNQGQGTALNRMFGMAAGDPIIKLDQDLLYSQGWLRRTLEILDANKPRSQSHGFSVPRAPEEPLIGLLGLLHYHHDPVASLKCKMDQHRGWQSHTHILGSAFAVRRECYRRLGPFGEHSESFSEDWDFQRKVTASDVYACGLPDEDLVVNQGMGIGPSTVVLGPGQVHPIHHEPYVFGR